jgi:hypothetical protein
MICLRCGEQTLPPQTEKNTYSFSGGDACEVLQGYIKPRLRASGTINKQRTGSSMRHLRVHVVKLTLVSLNTEDVPDAMYTKELVIQILEKQLGK